MKLVSKQIAVDNCNASLISEILKNLIDLNYYFLKWFLQHFRKVRSVTVLCISEQSI